MLNQNHTRFHRYGNNTAEQSVLFFMQTSTQYRQEPQQKPLSNETFSFLYVFIFQHVYTICKLKSYNLYSQTLSIICY